MNQLDNFKSNGSSVLNRYSRYLQKDFFRIDERSLSDLLNFIQDFSANIQFVNNDNEPEGDWSDFFNQNLAFQIASIEAFDTNSLNKRYKRGENALNKLKDTSAFNEQFLEQLTLIINLFKTINEWYVKSKINVVYLFLRTAYLNS